MGAENRSDASGTGDMEILSKTLFSRLTSSAARRNLRMASGLVLFTYIGAHLTNHALGLVSLQVAEAGLEIAVEVWSSLPGTVLLYGAAASHFLLALWAVYDRRTFRLPPAELLRIALGFTLPMILIGHAANTRLAWELYGLPSDYARVVSNLWVSDSQGWQLGLMAPGWLHGCLGLHFAFNRRPLFRQLRFVLFGAALLLPAFAAFGFLAMGLELATNAEAAAAALDYLSPANAPQRIAIAQWRNGLLTAYLAIIGAAFGARAVRNALERGRKRLISISYPGRTVRVPRGWTVLEASRERATLERIGAAPDVRLACQLRPEGDLSVIPLVRTERPVYRAAPPQRTAEREIVVLFCDFLNRAELAHDHMPQDMLYVLTLYIEALGKAIRAAHGTLSYVDPDSICALFGLERGLTQAARQALQAAGAIEHVMSDLNERLGRQWDCKVKIAVTLHAGRAVVGEIGSSDPPAMMAVGEAMDVANELRRTAAARGKAFAISQPVYAAAGLDAAFDDAVELPGSGTPIAASLSASAPERPPSWRPLGEQGRRAALERLWSG